MVLCVLHSCMCAWSCVCWIVYVYVCGLQFRLVLKTVLLLYYCCTTTLLRLLELKERYHGDLFVTVKEGKVLIQGRRGHQLRIR